mgnify:CR=1 FL=1
MLYLGTMGQGIISFDTQTKEFARFVDVGCNVISFFVRLMAKAFCM